MFAAIFNVAGNPIEPPLLREATMPGGARHIAFLRSKEDGSPAGACDLEQLHGRFWILGRVRLDGRRELQDRLPSPIAHSPAAISDALLCLHAYAAWGERFVDFLAGDFCFALWDARRGRLLSVRDQMGVRSLFHAHAGDSWFVSDSLDWIAAQPTIDRALDDHWIADFLTMGYSREFGRTVYRDIGLLRPAGLLRLGEGGAQFETYWRLVLDEPLSLSTSAAYTERFRGLLSDAIADRLPAGTVGISMSGGLDSTTLAACAVTAAGAASRVVAECETYEQFPLLKEEYFASLAAQHLGIGLNVRKFDALCYDPQWRSRGIRCAQPEHTIVNADTLRRVNRELAGRSAVWLHGEGPDNALSMDGNAYLAWLFKQRSWNRFGRALLQQAKVKGVTGWMQTLRRYSARAAVSESAMPLPPWLDREFVDRSRLAERIREKYADEAIHPWHPRAMTSFTGPLWQRHFGDFEFQEALAPVVWRHPYFDLRVLNFMLSVPPIPWGWKKRLLREAMRDRLPAEVVTREKAPLPHAPELASIRSTGLPELSKTGELARYVDVRQFSTDGESDYALQCKIAVHALDYWLAQDSPQVTPLQ